MKNGSILPFWEKILQVLLLLAISCFSGIIAGMGMGGGTFLIPLLSIVFGVEQIICQSTNVVCFIVLASICFYIYIKNKLIDFKALIFVSVPAGIIAFFGSLFAIRTNSEVLRLCFAIFIILVGVFYFVKSIFAMRKKPK